MDKDQFWQIIEEANELSENDIDAQVNLLVEALEKLSVEEILDFDRIFNEMFVKSYTTELWSAAFLINGDCTEDSFDYFRGWLIAQGQDVFELAVKDPEVLAEVVNTDIAGDIECEAMLYVAGTAYENKTKKDDFDFLTMGNFDYQNMKLDLVEEENHLSMIFKKIYKNFNT
jgi:hypothetical protein